MYIYSFFTIFIVINFVIANFKNPKNYSECKFFYYSYFYLHVERLEFVFFDRKSWRLLITSDITKLLQIYTSELMQDRNKNTLKRSVNCGLTTENPHPKVMPQGFLNCGREVC